jgi:hypothetical protein
MDGLFLYGVNLFNRKKLGMENENTKVGVTLGYTLNLGNFQSLRIDLNVVDSKRDGENVNEAFERVYAFVESKLIEKINDAKSEIAE